MQDFSNIGVHANICLALEKNSLSKPTEIQAQAIPAIIANKDVMCIAPTGTGKTLCYVIPILQALESNKDIINRQPPALILVPTRELTLQVKAVFDQINNEQLFEIKSMAIHGGTSINIQMKNLMNVEIVIATPGRLIDLLNAKSLKLNNVKYLVIDEADKMLNLGFAKQMEEIISLLPAKKQSVLLSAPLAQDIESMASLCLKNPARIAIKEKTIDLDLIKQTAYGITAEKKGPFLRQLIQQNKMTQVLIFTSSVHRADAVVDKLVQNGIHAEALHSKRSQSGRTNSLADFKSGKLTVLVATDLASRGIDIVFLPYVINYELPRSPKDYIHRIGRTGRAQNPGEAISLVAPEEEHHFGVIQKKMKRIIELQLVN